MKAQAVSTQRMKAAKPSGRCRILPPPTKTLMDAVQPFKEALPEDAAQTEVQKELTEALPVFKTDVDGFQKALAEQEGVWK